MSEKNKETNQLVEIIGNRRYSEGEVELLRRTFGARPEVYLAVRNLFYGFDLDEIEKNLIKDNFGNPEIRKLMRKIFLPELQKDIPINQNYDLWKTTDIQGATWDTIDRVKEVKYKFFELMEKSLKHLEYPSSKPVDVRVDKESSLEFLLARNSYLDSVDARLSKDIAPMAAVNPLTLAEAMERIKKDSAK